MVLRARRYSAAHSKNIDLMQLQLNLPVSVMQQRSAFDVIPDYSSTGSSRTAEPHNVQTANNYRKQAKHSSNRNCQQEGRIRGFLAHKFDNAAVAACAVVRL